MNVYNIVLALVCHVWRLNFVSFASSAMLRMYTCCIHTMSTLCTDILMGLPKDNEDSHTLALSEHPDIEIRGKVNFCTHDRETYSCEYSLCQG